MPRVIKKVITGLKPEQIHRIIDAIDENSLHGKRDKLFLRTMWETAGRISEVSQLRMGNINLDNKTITLLNLKQEKRKPLTMIFEGKIITMLDDKGNKCFWEQKPPPPKTINLSDNSKLCKDLIDYCVLNNINEKTDYIFGGNLDLTKPLENTYIWRLLCGKRGVSRELGITRAKKMKNGPSGIETPAWPHLFRHSRAQLILNETGQMDIVQKILGHANLETSRQYAETEEARTKKVIGGMSE